MDERVTELTIDMPGKDRMWTVTFEHRGSAFDEDASLFSARAESGDELHRSEWTISNLLGLSHRQQLRPNWRFQGLVRYFRTNLEAIISENGYKKSFGMDDARLFLELAGGTYLQRVAREIEAILFQLALSDGRGTYPSTQEWDIAGPQLHHSTDIEVRATVPALHRFYEKYGEVISDEPEQLDLGEVNSLGNVALRRIGAASLALRTNGQNDAASAVHQAVWPQDKPVHLISIRLSNIRRFRDPVSVPLSPPRAERGQWVVLLGDNGTGKTTILRAIALALLRDDIASASLTKSSADAALISKPVSNGHGGYVSVALDAEVAKIALISDRGRERLSIEDPSLTLRPPLFGYGCRRGSALGGREREADADPLAGAETLFDENAALLHAETWLRKIELEAAQRPERRGFVEAVKRALISVLPEGDVEELIIEPDSVLVRGGRIGEVPLAALSDGYLTTLGWTIDFIARWITYARTSNGYDLGEQFHQQMSCVVLIDELDLHLHPRWQRDIISNLRNAFPMTTFIATTHNPLTLLGTEPGEVHVIGENDDGSLEIIQRDLPKGIRADQVLTDDWFGLRSTVDNETMEWLDKHRDMLRQNASTDDPARIDLESKLRERLGRFAETSSERLAQELVAQHFDRYDQPVTDEDRASLRELYAKSVLERNPAKDEL